MLKHIKTLCNELFPRIPSILGRDVINRYRLLMDRSRDFIVITDEEIA